MAKRCVQKILERIIVSFCVILCMQLPFFIIQYTHQLKGHLDELKWQVEGMEKSAACSGKNLHEYISKFTQSSDRDFSHQGMMMHVVTQRYEKLSHAWVQLNNSSILARPYVFFRYVCLDVFYATASNFKMGISFTFESIVYGLSGIFVGSGLCSFVSLCFNRKQKRAYQPFLADQKMAI